MLSCHAQEKPETKATMSIELNTTSSSIDISRSTGQNLRKKINQQAAWLDFVEGFKKWRIWLMLAYQDIRLRYRRSILGPFWLTLSMAITVYSMGYLYSHLFHIDLKTYFPFLVSGMLGWGLISTIIMEYTDGFLTADGLIKQIKLPYTLHIHRIITRNIIIFFHNIVVIIPIYFIFHTPVGLNFLLLLPGLAVLYLNAIAYGLILAIVGARFRDISPIVKSLVQVIFFVTPVMWNPSMLSEKNRFFFVYNPFYSFLELIRNPLLGSYPSTESIIMVFLVTSVGIILSAILFTKYRARIIYWL